MAEEIVYGAPPPELAAPSLDALQVSPLIPGAEALEDVPDATVTRAMMLAPPGTLERRFALAQALRALRTDGELTALAPKDKGGSRLRKELESFGCSVDETARRHHRICRAARPSAPIGVADAIAAGGPRIAPALNLWSQPGVFSWDRLDPGSAALLAQPLAFAGRGADLGCGLGVLARPVLMSADVTSLTLIDIDARAVAAARRNIDDPRALFLHADVRQPAPDLTDLDFVIMNPPFHDAGHKDSALGVAFIGAAARMLRKGGVCRLVANNALPYEAALIAHFVKVVPLARTGSYKVFEARK